MASWLVRSSGLGSCPGRETLCYTLGQDTLLSKFLSPPGEFNAGGNPVMDLYPVQGEVNILLVASCYRTGISSSLMGHLACMQTSV